MRGPWAAGPPGAYPSSRLMARSVVLTPCSPPAPARPPVLIPIAMGPRRFWPPAGPGREWEADRPFPRVGPPSRPFRESQTEISVSRKGNEHFSHSPRGHGGVKGGLVFRPSRRPCEGTPIHWERTHADKPRIPTIPLGHAQTQSRAADLPKSGGQRRPRTRTL